MRNFQNEAQEQLTVVQYLTLLSSRLNFKFHASPNGGSRNIVEARKLKLLGCSPGFPDLFIAKPWGVYNGLFVEMKRKDGGKISETQKNWIEYLNMNNYCAKVCAGADEAMLVIDEYFEIKRF